MNCNAYCYSLGLLTALTACAPKATPGVSSRSATSTAAYNGYNDDLSVVRPSYVIKASPPGSLTAAKVAPVSKAAPVALPRSSATPPTVPGAPVLLPTSEVLHVNKRLDALLDTIAQQNRSVRYAAGYRIQVYVGNEREEADAAKLQLYQAFPELSPYLSYKQPTYRLKVGDFMRRLDAEWYLSQLKQQFTSVLLQPDKVDIRRSLLIK